MDVLCLNEESDWWMHHNRLQAGDKVSQGGTEASAEAGARKFIAKLRQSSKRL